MRRILVIGCPGSGKSTLAARLAAVTGLPLIALDRAYWRPGWLASPRGEWGQTIATLTARPAWIMDGNYSATLPERLARADMVVWLDYPRHVCMRRVIWRTARRLGRVDEGLPEGCPPRFDVAFLRHVWNFKTASRPRVVAALESHGAHIRLHRLMRDADGERLLQELSCQRAEIRDIPAGEA